METGKFNKEKFDSINRYLDNISIEALKQTLRFVLNSETSQELNSNLTIIHKQINEFNRMYPYYKND